MSRTIVQIPTTDPTVYAFRISGEVGLDEMKTMSEAMNVAFDIHDKVSMLIIFDPFDGSALGAQLNFESFRAQLRALSKIDKYVVVGAPEEAAKLISTAGDWIGIDTASFDASEEQAAWRFIGAKVRNAA